MQLVSQKRGHGVTEEGGLGHLQTKTSRMIKVTKPELTVLTDVEIQDGTSLDAHLQVHYERGTTMAGFWSMIKDMQITIRTSLVWLQVGNCQIPFAPIRHVSPVNQLKKLVTLLIKMYPLTIKRVYVASVLPRADHEAELENDIMEFNRGLSQAVRELKRYDKLGKWVVFVPVHCIFLERYKYVNLSTGQLAHMVRIVKPLERYFMVGTPKLNPVGKYHLKSFMLQMAGVLTEVNSWVEMPQVVDHPEMQKQKKQAWVKAREYPLQEEETVHSSVSLDDQDTDLEDEEPVTMQECVQGQGCSLIFVRGKAKEPFDPNLDFDVTM